MTDPHVPGFMRDHWWWRPGWREGRSFYTWHLTFADQPDVRRFAAEYRRALDGLPGLDLIPDAWLHLTMQGIGFAGETAETTAEEIADAAAFRLAALPAFDITLHAPVVDPEALLVPVHPQGPVTRLRNAIRNAVGDVLAEVPETAEGFVPHVSLAYSNSDRPAAPFAEALAATDIRPANASITHADLIRINRDHRMYEWSEVRSVRLG
ncbi:2'-5' RNA ligase family protein [Actinacidiphila sp. ITFR-21]|uniref:2'-5' RNA ligase family protein n=1 Tax=Actinacidiphila sp. ITFR-21 TaxID=3075199 RepID=UPI0028892561|nr:2'-5' RNA ligase family protein [Streptomyces sp. ITFR-21]WNI17066.1 2'-5' RNA ligase family protein [Streptomyces sp. ITFR-21]